MGGSEKEAPLLASTAAGESGDKGDDETGRSEVILLLKLAGPLLVANIAEEVSLLFMYVFWANLGSCKGHSTAGADCVAEFQKHGMGAGAKDCPPGCHYNDGTMQLAAANDMYSGSQMAIVFIFGAQQAVYTMAPQAYGAGNYRQVGIILQMCLFWSLVVLGLPTALAWASMGEAMDFAGLLSDDCGGSNATNATQANATHAALTPSHAVGANSSALNIPVHHRRLAAEGGDDEQLVDVIGSYGVASCWYLGPYVLMYTLMTWLESIEVVAWAEPLKAVGSVARTPIGYVLMWTMGYGLNGFAYGSAIGYGLSCVLILYIVFYKQGAHRPYWHGWDLKAALDPDLNWRFFKMSCPLIVQYALQNWANSFFQMLMSRSSCQLAAAYGSTTAFTNTGGSVSTALYVATSVRVGACLGEDKAANARESAKIGMAMATVAGLFISVLIFLFRAFLSNVFSPSGKGSPVYQFTLDAVPLVAVYYWLNSLCWGTWAILQGQMRNRLTSVAMIFGIWGVSIPLSVIFVDMQLLGPGVSEQLKGVWVACCVGEGTIVLLMCVAIWKSDWEALAREAVESAEIIDAADGEEMQEFSKDTGESGVSMDQQTWVFETVKALGSTCTYQNVLDASTEAKAQPTSVIYCSAPSKLELPAVLLALRDRGKVTWAGVLFPDIILKLADESSI